MYLYIFIYQYVYMLPFQYILYIQIYTENGNFRFFAVNDKR